MTVYRYNPDEFRPLTPGADDHCMQATDGGSHDLEPRSLGPAWNGEEVIVFTCRVCRGSYRNGIFRPVQYIPASRP